MLNKIYEATKEEMQKSISNLQKEFFTLRSNRVSINILDSIKVDCYDSKMSLKEVATLTSVDATTLLISPYDKGMIKVIEKALQEANLGVNPNADAAGIKLFFPPMTSDQRAQIAKNAKAMSEKAKIAIRNIRQDSNNQVKKLEKDKEITSDELKKANEQIQKHTDTFIKKIEDITKQKEEEILKI